MSKRPPKSQPKMPMTAEAAARIQSTEAKRQGGQVLASDFAARAQRAAAGHNKVNGIQ